MRGRAWVRPAPILAACLSAQIGLDFTGDILVVALRLQLQFCNTGHELLDPVHDLKKARYRYRGGRCAVWQGTIKVSAAWAML